MLSTTRMQKIMVELTLGQTPKAANEEEAEFIRKVAMEIKEIQAKGGEVSMPSEWPDAD